MAAVKKEESVSDLIVELVDLATRYARQEIQSIIDGAVVGPIKKAGFWAGFSAAAGALCALALIFLAVGFFQLLAEVVGATWIAYLIIGGALSLLAIIVLLIRGRFAGGG